jgi:hypothetical protein
VLNGKALCDKGYSDDQFGVPEFFGRIVDISVLA